MNPCLVLGALALVAGAAPAPPQALRQEQPQGHFDDVHQETELTHRFAFTNVGERPLTIQETFAPGGGAELALSTKVLAPGARGELLVKQQIGARLGATTFRYSLVTDEPGSPRYRFGLTGFVESAYDPEQLRVGFASADRATGASTEKELSSREVERLELLEVLDAPPHLVFTVAGRAGLAGEGLLLKATLKPGAPLGFQSGEVRLRTNVPRQPVVRIPWAATVYGDVAPSIEPVALGLGRVGESLARDVLLRSRTGKAFEIARIEDPAAATWTQAACVPDEPSCRRLTVTFRGEVPTTARGEARIFLHGDAEPLPLRWTAHVVSPGAVVKDIQVP